MYNYHTNNCLFFIYSQIISYDSDRGGVSVVTEKGPKTTTNLIVRGAKEEDSGVYTCNPSTASKAKVIVHILDGKLKK